MDITSCLHEWYKITSRITPRSKTEELRMRLFHRCYFDNDRLVEQIDRLTEIYGTGDHLYEDEPEGARTRHVFVAALQSDAKGYNLFRTYDIPVSAGRLLEGPETPRSFKISRAFGVTGAARYFAPKWTEQMATSGITRFRDTKFPEPHNITELALDEMWGIYGTDVPLSVVVNIGPGLPSDNDVKLIARRFSWGLNTSHSSSCRKEREPPTVTGSASTSAILPSRPVGTTEHGTQRHSVHFSDDSIKEDPDADPSVESDCPHPPFRTTTFGSIKDRGIDVKLKRLESRIERDIEAKLKEFYPRNDQLYYRLAPNKAPEGTTQNDSSESGVAFDTTLAFLSGEHIRTTIHEVARRLSIDEKAQRLPSANAVSLRIV